MRHWTRSAAGLVGLALAGCAAAPAPDVAQSWVGRRADDLAAAWGAPSAVDGKADGSRTITYRQEKSERVASEYGGYTANWQCTASFVADAAGRIVSAASEGNAGGCKRLFGGR